MIYLPEPWEGELLSSALTRGAKCFGRDSRLMSLAHFGLDARESERTQKSLRKNAGGDPALDLSILPEVLGGTGEDIQGRSGLAESVAGTGKPDLPQARRSIDGYRRVVSG